MSRLLLLAVRDQVRAAGGGAISDALAGFLEACHFAAAAHEHREAMSELGRRGGQPIRMDAMTSPDEAGAAVGISGRHVRRLCAAGQVRHERTGARGYLVDVDSLRDYLRSRP